jgi:23S rRNA (cytosine1962-C5)-methyltransferase
MPQSPVRFLENGIYFEADLIAGQKTGFFLDQRDNRARVEGIAAGKKVLNLFAYTGGFSLYAARGGAREVVSADISQPALAGALSNFRLNTAHPQIAAAKHELLVGDAFRTLHHLQQTKRKFDLVVIDPPTFAKKQAEIDRALAAYGRLAALGVQILRPGGQLVIASCSSRVPAALFFDTVHRAAWQVERPLTEIARTGHAVDHPVTFPEAAYLKCLFADAA